VPSSAVLSELWSPVLWTLLFGVLASWCWRVIALSQVCRSWPRSQCVLLNATVREEVSDTTHYHPAVLYQYIVNGRTLKVHRVQFGGYAGSVIPTSAELRIRLLRLDSKLEVMYHPKKPELCTLVAGAPTSTWFVAISLSIATYFWASRAFAVL